MQEAITLTVFVPFAMFYMNQPFKLDYVWAGTVPGRRGLFIFRSLSTALRQDFRRGITLAPSTILLFKRIT